MLLQGFFKVTVEKRSFATRGDFGWVIRVIERVSNREVVILIPLTSLSVRLVEELVQVRSIVKVLIF